MQKSVFFCIYLTREIVYKVLEHLLVRQRPNILYITGYQALYHPDTSDLRHWLAQSLIYHLITE